MTAQTAPPTPTVSEVQEWVERTILLQKRRIASKTISTPVAAQESVDMLEMIRDHLASLDACAAAMRTPEDWTDDILKYFDSYKLATYAPIIRTIRAIQSDVRQSVAAVIAETDRQARVVMDGKSQTTTSVLDLQTELVGRNSIIMCVKKQIEFALSIMTGNMDGTQPPMDEEYDAAYRLRLALQVIEEPPQHGRATGWTKQ